MVTDLFTCLCPETFHYLCAETVQQTERRSDMVSDDLKSWDIIHEPTSTPHSSLLTPYSSLLIPHWKHLRSEGIASILQLPKGRSLGYNEDVSGMKMILW